MRAGNELFHIAEELTSVVTAGEDPAIVMALERLENAADQVEKAFSGSCWGYHSKVYYEDFEPPPAGAHFSQEWGLMDRFSMGSSGRWVEYDAAYVDSEIRRRAGNPDLKEAELVAGPARVTFHSRKSDVQSILSPESSDPYVAKLISELEALDAPTARQFEQAVLPRGQIMTRDTVVIGQGLQVPPHLRVLSEVVSIRAAFKTCASLSSLSRKAGSHLERKSSTQRGLARVGTNVFIGHGRSPLWREVKDFVSDRMGLPWDEFNRVPVAGVTNIARLSEMLDSAAIALIIMTAEDEMSDGEMQARMNVVHEVGLFQGRLSFTKAIVILEEGCKEFTNIQGLGQIRFPKGRISAAFEEIR